MGWLLAMFVLGFVAGHTACYLKASSAIDLAKEIVEENTKRIEKARLEEAKEEA